MPKAGKLRSIRASELRKVTAGKLRTFDAEDLRDVTTEELEELCEAPGDQGCADQLKAAAEDRQMLKTTDFFKETRD
ncbi:hypothetical protein [Desulfoscipio geothermicus]|uniref:Uncharacterized protein n=1 Tax=Desulfoscipio geothermicus DSM 3669 TaxID=1121426 RepID=A0A1I6D6N2_9FIRM|nr:hypothetical protein [Desulfoscipio geothermicus]SFR01063.1 hypothetical protein SAMN05660706_10655 [Desulfoscipio geothermicus DSM 3669]